MSKSGAGTGKCPKCSKNGTLSKCNNCKTIKCETCWSKQPGRKVGPCEDCGKK